MATIKRIKYMLETRIAFILALLWLVFLGMKTLEPIYHPVVKDFTIVSTQYYDNEVKIKGFMLKVRGKDDCLFAGVTAQGNTYDNKQVHIPLVFRDSKNDDTATRDVGYQDWGPWVMTIPITPEIESVTLTSIHTCNPLWDTRTTLASIPIQKINQIG